MYITSIRRKRFKKDLVINLSIIKDFLKIEHSMEDKIIENIVYGAIESCEKYIDYSLLNAKWEVNYRKLGRDYFVLPIRPAVDIISMQYSYLYGTAKTIDPKYYKLIDGAVCLKFIPHAHSMKVEYTAGFGNSIETLPDGLQSILLEHIAHLYENRSGKARFDMNKYDNFRNVFRQAI